MGARLLTAAFGHPVHPVLQARLRAFFAEIDMDGGGTLDRGEIELLAGRLSHC